MNIKQALRHAYAEIERRGFSDRLKLGGNCPTCFIGALHGYGDQVGASKYLAPFIPGYDKAHYLSVFADSHLREHNVNTPMALAILATAIAAAPSDESAREARMLPVLEPAHG